MSAPITEASCNCGWPRTTDGEHGDECPARAATEQVTTNSAPISSSLVDPATAQVDISVGNMLHVADWHQQRAETCVPGTSDWRWHTRTAGILRAVAKERDDHVRSLTACEKRVADLEALEALLYDGNAVFDAMKNKPQLIALRRTSPENVSDTLDAMNRAWRAILAKGETK